MKQAVISDIHSNLEAFQATLVDIETQNVDKISCLGDLVGYGPNPLECIDLMMKLCDEGKIDVCLLGNHDQATLFDPEGFNKIAEEAVFWTRGQLENSRSNRAQARWDFLGGEIKRFYKNDKFMYVHGSPRNPLNEYVFSEDVADEEKMSKLFSLIPQICFLGHTHVPGVFAASGDGKFTYTSYAEMKDGIYPIDGSKLLVNVGSVGQPRDHDPRSCYVIVHYNEGSSDNRLEYRRVEYEIDKTCGKISKIDELNPFLGQRIKEGR